LLTEHRLDRELGTVDRARRAQPRVLLDDRREAPILGEYLDDAQGIGVEVEQPARLADRGRQVRHRLKLQRAADVAVDGLEADDRGAVWQAQRATVGAGTALGDSGHGADAQPTG